MLSITCLQLKEMLEAKDKIFLLDVRAQWERDECRLENDTHIAMGSLERRSHELDKESKIVVYCHHGIRSKKAALLLEESGFTQVCHLEGGIHAWAKEIDSTMETY